MLSTSPFDAFERHEQSQGLPAGFIRSLNATNPHDNAWARLERNEVDFDRFCDEFEAEAVAAGGRVDARALFAALSGEMRPAMLEAVRRCHEHFKTGLLTNNFITPETTARHTAVFDLFDVVHPVGRGRRAQARPPLLPPGLPPVGRSSPRPPSSSTTWG